MSRSESAQDDRSLDLVPSARTPRWRRLLVWALVIVPVMTLGVADLARVVDPDREPGAISGWTGAALCAVWLTQLTRAMPPVARVADRIEAAAAALASAALVLGLQLPLPWLGLAAAIGVAVLVLRRPARRTVAPRDRVDRDRDAAGTVAFSETSADPTRAVLIAVGCAGFAAFGIVTTMTVGPSGWWYLLASALWFTGAVPWMLRVTLDRTGFVVRTLLLPGALVRVPLADIDDVEAGRVQPRRWGGTGCIVEGGVTSVLRAEGGAVLVTRTDGSQVVVNVDRPDEAVATFAALRAGEDAS